MKIEIFEEGGDNTLSFGDKYADFTIDVYPDSKTFQSRMSLKYDLYYRTETFEYRIQANPLKVETRLTQRVDEPPQRYCVKDNVVLESDILVDRKEVASSMSSMTKEFIDGLKKEVEWHDEWTGSPVSMYILSKHSEIVSADDYRHYLRQFAENIKTATLKIEDVLASDPTGLKVTDDYTGSGRMIWYSEEKQNSMSEEETKNAIEHLHKIQEKVFDEKSTEYVGISDGEFKSSPDILETIETFLNIKPASIKKDIEPTTSKTMGFIISLLLTLFLSWIVSWFVNINPFLIFLMVQVIAFAQSIVASLLGKVFAIK
jgi:hypothetical protein